MSDVTSDVTLSPERFERILQIVSGLIENGLSEGMEIKNLLTGNSPVSPVSLETKVAWLESEVAKLKRKFSEPEKSSLLDAAITAASVAANPVGALSGAVNNPVVEGIVKSLVKDKSAEANPVGALSDAVNNPVVEGIVKSLVKDNLAKDKKKQSDDLAEDLGSADYG